MNRSGHSPWSQIWSLHEYIAVASASVKCCCQWRDVHSISNYERQLLLLLSLSGAALPFMTCRVAGCRLFFLPVVLGHIDRGNLDIPSGHRWRGGKAGEERFAVDWREDGLVWYEVMVFSRLANLVRPAIYPLVRYVQRQFGKQLAEAMENYMGSKTPQPKPS
ncbi:hypothetical protein CBR_g30366 [Chara braunii]|uniref:DUF1990 domain-containing protein n=1 Tax=Chara braunii TaxID=69332 RepID=A0A388JXE6_CHABU|nr:hypothetical protein CBR_g30366 [Chara braunii]|eukprot:GBG62412.1 hypothetical protein CBR_g30366 [Chara braunii]